MAHQSELKLLFGPIPEVASIENDFAATYRDFYINFVNDLNPGRKGVLSSCYVRMCH